MQLIKISSNVDAKSNIKTKKKTNRIRFCNRNWFSRRHGSNLVSARSYGSVYVAYKSSVMYLRQALSI